MEEYRLVAKIAEMRSYIASDWPNVEELKRLYAAIKAMEAQIAEARERAKFNAEDPR